MAALSPNIAFAPAQPGTPTLAAGSDSGASNTDDITNDTTPSVTGTAQAGTTVTLYDTNGTTVLGTGTADTNGVYTIASSQLAEGKHTLSVTAKDVSNNTSVASPGLAVTIDTTPPTVTASASQPVVAATSLAGAAETFSSGTSDAVDGSNTDLVTFTEQLAGGGTKVVHSGDTFAVGQHTIVASATDAAGNTASATPFSFLVTPLVIVGPIGVPAPKTDASLFGGITHEVTSAAGDVYALYETILGRAPDPLALETDTAALGSGTRITTMARDLLGSSEYTADHGPYADVPDSTFVNLLFEAGLHRSAGTAELQQWDKALDKGTSRAEVAADIALLPESRTDLTPTFDAGVFVPDITAARIARLYYGLLDRAPDAAGLSAAEVDAAHGTSLKTIAKDVIASPEYATLHGTQSNAQFVDALFEGALGKPADTGAATWTHALDAGRSRASVAIGIAESPEAAAHLLPAIEQGFRIS